MATEIEQRERERVTKTGKKIAMMVVQKQRDERSGPNEELLRRENQQGTIQIIFGSLLP
jgi:hypothetical protein